MFQGRRVVVCVPVGRYRYLRVLLSYLLADRHAEIVDEIRLWVNTDVPADLAYFERKELTNAKVKRVQVPGALNKSAYDESRNHFQFNDSIYRFYATCVEDNTIYIKMDDDICFVHDDFFKNMCAGVLEREQANYACVANVFNIPYVTKVLQDANVIADEKGRSTGDPRCPVACVDGAFAEYIHLQFLDKVEKKELEGLYFDSREIRGRQRIGTMAWTGASFQQFGGQVGPRDEVELTTHIPERLNKPLWMVGNALVSHYAFSHQRAHLEDNTEILDRYLALSIELNGDIAA